MVYIIWYKYSWGCVLRTFFGKKKPSQRGCSKYHLEHQTKNTYLDHIQHIYLEHISKAQFTMWVSTAQISTVWMRHLQNNQHDINHFSSFVYWNLCFLTTPSRKPTSYQRPFHWLLGILFRKKSVISVVFTMVFVCIHADLPKSMDMF